MIESYAGVVLAAPEVVTGEGVYKPDPMEERTPVLVVKVVAVALRSYTKGAYDG